MLPQTEDIRQIGGPTLPSNDVEDGKRPHKHWLDRGDCVDRSCRSPGVGHLVPGQGPHHPKRGDGASGPPRRVGRIAKTNCARPGDHPSWKCTAIHHFTDLCAHQWVPEEVVFRHWSARQARATACRHRHSGSRPATGAIAQQPEHRQGKSRACRDYQEPLPGVADEAMPLSQQDVDNAVGTYNANKAIVEANQANVKQLQALQSFEKIYAPFDGVITARNTDIGDLINSGSSGTVKTDLFHIAQPGTLRVYVNVPEEYSQGIKVGMTADLSLAEFPGRKFQGKLVRTADAINVTTRTLLIEIEVDNPTGTLLTGSYAEVHLKVPTQASTLLLPVNTLLFRSEGLRVGVVKDGKVVLTAVTPGHDFGNQIEIVSGLKPDDQVIINPPDSIVSGQQVQIVQATLPGDTK